VVLARGAEEEGRLGELKATLHIQLDLDREKLASQAAAPVKSATCMLGLYTGVTCSHALPVWETLLKTERLEVTRQHWMVVQHLVFMRIALIATLGNLTAQAVLPESPPKPPLGLPPVHQ